MGLSGIKLAMQRRANCTELAETMERREDYHDELMAEIVTTTDIAIDQEADLGFAHALFLNGKDKSGPIRNVKALSEASGVSQNSSPSTRQ